MNGKERNGKERTGNGTKCFTGNDGILLFVIFFLVFDDFMSLMTTFNKTFPLQKFRVSLHQHVVEHFLTYLLDSCTERKGKTE